MAKNKYRIALVVDFLTSEYSHSLYLNVKKYCDEKDYELLILPIGSLHSIKTPFGYQSAAISSILSSNLVDGIIYSAGSQLHHVSTNELVSHLKAFNPIPVVCIAAQIPGFPSVSIDCEKAYRKIISNMIHEQKCKKFAILGIRSSSAEIKDRRNVIRKVLEEYGISREDYTYFRMSFDYLSVVKELETYTLSNGGKINFDAVICLTDDIAFACTHFLESRGYSVPKDVVVAGFDNQKQSDYNVPSITSVDQNINLQAFKAVQMLTSIYEDEGFEKNVVVDSFPVFRESTAKFPYSAALKMDDNVVVKMDMEKLLYARNVVAEIYLQRARIWKVTQYFSETTFGMTVEQLKNRLNSDLRNFNLQAGAIVLYDSPVEMPIPFDYFNLPHRASLFTGFDDSTGYDSELIPERIKFDPNERILPDGILNFGDNGLVCVALYHNTLQYGYFVFRADDNFDFIVYDFIVRIVASLISSVVSYTQVSKEQNKFRKKFKELDIVANTDELTGLYNRRGLFDFGQTTLKFSKAMNQTGLLIYGDMDGLKKINDNYGHEAGDRAIIAESIILKGNFRSNDIIARIGGDEFVIISPGLTEEAFERIQENIVADCRLWTETNKTQFDLSISLGFVKFPSEKVGYQITPLLSEADSNLYIKKRSRNGI